jgi:hypothetical protein
VESDPAGIEARGRLILRFGLGEEEMGIRGFQSKKESVGKVVEGMPLFRVP